MTKKFYVYILQCSNNSLYTGYTHDPENRIRLHVSGKGAKYTRSFKPIKLVYLKCFDTKSDALSNERKIKSLTVAQKHELIQKYLADELDELIKEINHNILKLHSA